MQISNGPASPCHGCQKRWRTDTQSCHGECKEYADFKSKRAEYTDRVKRNKSRSLNYWSYVYSKKDTPTRNT